MLLQCTSLEVHAPPTSRQNAVQVAERGLNFVATFGELMADAQLPPLLREAWSFSACMSLVITLARLAPGAPAPGPSTLLPPSVSDAGCA